MTKIIGNNYSPDGRNESFKIGSRNHVLRATGIKEAEEGKQHPDIIKINGRKY